MRRESPLCVIHRTLGQRWGQELPKLDPSQRTLKFTYGLPAGTIFGEPDLGFWMRLSWEKKTEELTIITTPTQCVPFQPWEGMGEFFVLLTENTKVFFDDAWKAGMLLPYANSDGPLNKLFVGHNIILECRGGEERHLIKAFDCVHGCSMLALLITRPIMSIIAQTRRVPNGFEQLEILEREMERYDTFAQSLKTPLAPAPSYLPS